ncbi:hypothetical protein M0R72_20485 [Candidatus Pacearchaeota archaeon]|jgi:hypothetical protein|nr:hypothetical protein [Candidatus Pacearchaeota archaeon]
MKKDQFRFELARAGYTFDQIAEVEQILRRCASIPCHPDEMRKAAHDYLFICADISKLKGFLLTVDNLSRGYALSWDQASDVVTYIIIGWCH